jgi:hypothetical protein
MERKRKFAGSAHAGWDNFRYVWRGPHCVLAHRDLASKEFNPCRAYLTGPNPVRHANDTSFELSRLLAGLVSPLPASRDAATHNRRLIHPAGLSYWEALYYIPPVIAQQFNLSTAFYCSFLSCGMFVWDSCAITLPPRPWFITVSGASESFRHFCLHTILAAQRSREEQGGTSKYIQL